MTTPPTILTNSSMTVSEGCASVADASGNLLFYTDGATIWDQTHSVMANGTGLLGTNTPVQSCLILKKPGSATLYYIFTIQGNPLGPAGLNYSIVDMSLSAGAGSVTVKNTNLFSSTCAEKITGTRHCNGTDFWIVTHDLNSTNFRAHLLTASGVNSTPVISSIGTLYGGAFSVGLFGAMKISPNGKKLGAAVSFGLDLFDFDNTTGTLSNFYTIPLNNLYGCEFSPDGTVFYAGSVNGTTGGYISQFNLCAGSYTAVIASQYTMSTSSFNGVASMQLAPDGKIYIARTAQQSLGVINNPNIMGSGCNYVVAGQSIFPKISASGLPNFAAHYFLRKPPIAPFTYTINNSIACQTASFTSPNTSTVFGCAASGYSLIGVGWDFGDPSSGSANTSTLISPIHAYTGLGTFTTQLVFYYSCGGGTDTLKQTVNVTQPCLTISSTSISCSGPGSATVSVISGIGPYSYTWMPTAQTNSIATGLYPGTYTITVFNAGNNTSFSTTTTFSSVIPFTGTLSSSGLLNCNGVNTGTASISLSGVSGGQNYLWSNGIITQTTAIATGLGIGTYSLNVTDPLTNCAFSQTFQITQPPALTLNISSSPTACAGSSVALSSIVSGGTPGYTYSWTGGPTSANYNASQPLGGGYIYTLTVYDFNNCMVTNTIALSFVNNPILSVTNVSVCPGATGTLNVSGASSYTWLPSLLAGNVFTASPAATTLYTVSGSALGCSSNATAAIILKPLPALTFNTFSITCANLGSATVNATGGIGPFSYTWSPILQTTSVVTNLNPNTYTLTVFDLGTSCTSNTSTVFTSSIPLTGTLVSTSSLNCNNLNTGTAAITGITGGSGNQNYLWNNGINSYTVSNPTNLSAGTWSSLVTDVLTGCKINSTFVITQPPALTLNIAASTPTTCLGANIILTGTNSGGTPGYTYTWSAGPSSNTNTVNETSAGTYIYTLNSSDANNCLTTNTISVDFVPNPTLSVSDVSICPITVGTLTVSGAATYSWNGVAGGSIFSQSPVASGQYTVIGSALGCTSMATASIIVMPGPNPFVSSNSPRCNGDNLVFTYVGGISYVWDGPNSFSSVLQNPTISPVSINDAGVYTLTVTAVNGCTASITKTIVVNPTPTVSAFGSTLCTSQTLNLSSNSNAASYYWSGPLSFSSTLQNPSILNPLLTNSGTYTVKVTSTQNCSNIAVTQVSVVAPPSLTISLSSNSLCAQALNGSPHTITLTSSGANSYTLFTPLVSTPVTSSSTALNSLPPYTPGPATATLMGSNGVCIISTTSSFVVIPNPTVTINSPTPVICAGNNFTYTSFGAASYTWGPNSPGITTYSTGSIAVANPSINSVFSVYGGSLGCNSAIQTTSITVNPLPNFSLSPATAIICLGNKINLSANGSGTSYTWAPYSGINTAYGSVVYASPSAQQTYTVVGSLNSCTNIAMITVSVLTLPSPSVTVLKPTVCLNETVTLQGFGGKTYKWYGPNSIYYEGQTVNFTANSYIYGGTYTLTVADKNDCKASATTFVTINNLPDGSLLGTQMKGCAPFTSDFTYYSALATSTSIATQWTLDQKTFSTKSFSNEFKVPGNYTITANFRDTLTNCLNTRTFTVEAYPVPVADFTYLPEKPIENLEEVIFTNTSKGEEQKKWDWFFVNNQGHRSQNKNTAYLFTEAGLYPIAMVVTNTWGCADTVVKSLYVESDLTVYVPNVFTPNGDDLNEVFLPIVRAIKSYELLVFDRWGAKVFSTTNTETGWDGSYRGEACKVDVYVWKINLSSVNGEMKTLTGSVLLSR